MADIKEILISSQVSRVQPGQAKRQGSPVPAKDAQAFERALDQESVKLSKHALRRLDSRDISLSDTQQTKLSDAMSSLEKKGARDSLVLMGELAFIVNVPSKTVVTAITKDQMKEQVFTNIDSTMFVEQ